VNDDKFDIPTNLLRSGSNPSMVLLADCPQPYRSVFNYGDSRHDKFGSVVNEEGTRFQKNLVKNEPTRKNLDWLDSQVCNQGSMTMRRRQVTKKIGF
jgi:hypothetical protein